MDHNIKIWIDALDFDRKGGWKEDTQFTHLTGSGFLIAADEPGVPVEDAAVSAGMVTLKVSCLNHILLGNTTSREFIRVLGYATE